MIKVAIGQDSHRFCQLPYPEGRKLILGGVIIDGEAPLSGNSDADVILHALTNAITGITCIPVLGAAADEMCKAGITDSREYVKVALKDLKGDIHHVSFSVEAKRPKLLAVIPDIRRSVAKILGIDVSRVMLTATSGEGLTDFGRGHGIQVFCALTVDCN